MNAYALIGALIAALTYLPLTIKVWKGLPQNFATYMLWGMLDVIAARSIILKGGNFALPAIYVLSCFAVLIAILHSGTFKWGALEWRTSALVLISVIVWMFVGDRAATVVSTIAVGVADAPQLVDFWRNPRDAPLWEYVGFSLANGISVAAGKDWSIEERFYPTVCTVLVVVFVAVAARRWLPQFREQLI